MPVAMSVTTPLVYMLIFSDAQLVSLDKPSSSPKHHENIKSNVFVPKAVLQGIQYILNIHNQYIPCLTYSTTFENNYGSYGHSTQCDGQPLFTNSLCFCVYHLFWIKIENYYNLV